MSSIDYQLPEKYRRYIYFLATGSRRRRNRFVLEAKPVHVRSINPEKASGKTEPEGWGAAATARDKVSKVQRVIPPIEGSIFVGADVSNRRSLPNQPDQPFEEMEVLHNLKRVTSGRKGKTKEEKQAERRLITEDKVKTLNAYTTGVFKMVSEIANSMVIDNEGEGDTGTELPGATGLLLIEVVYEALDPVLIEKAYQSEQAFTMSSRLDLPRAAERHIKSVTVYDPQRPEVTLTPENYHDILHLVHGLIDANLLPTALFEQLLAAAEQAAENQAEVNLVYDLSVLQYLTADDNT